MHEHGHADGSLVRDPLVDETVLPEHEAVVAHVDDEGLLVDAHRAELVHDPSQAVIDRHEGLVVALVVALDVEGAVIRKVDAVPAVALVSQPARLAPVVLEGVGLAIGTLERSVVETSFVAFGRGEVGMDGLVRQVQEERFLGRLLLLQPIHGIVRELCR